MPVKVLKPLYQPLYHTFSDLPNVHTSAQRLYWGSVYRKWCNDNPCRAFANREELYDHVVRTAGLEEGIDYLEFGVWQGNVLRWWIDRNRDPSSIFTGFDSFEGLPEQWDGNPVGTFSTGGQLPELNDSRVRFVKGYFQETFHHWIKTQDFGRRLVVHLDADLYSSTLLVLVPMLPWLKAGDVVMFDEMHSYMHEFRAFCDANAAYQRKFEVLARANEWGQVAMRVV
jgi:O-methyltransferase